MINNIDLALESGAGIFGRVLNGNLDPIEGVTLRLTNASGSSMAETSSSSDGTYALTGIPDGTWYVRTVNNQGLLDEWYDDVLRMSHNPVSDGANGLPLLNEVVALNIDFQLITGGTLGGRITGPGGAPIAGIDIDVYSTSGQFIRGSTSAADGTYTVIALPAGDVYVNTFVPGGIYFDEW